jgi:hypothetical protein
MKSHGFDPWTLEGQIAAAVDEWDALWPRASVAFARTGDKRVAFRLWDRHFGNGGADD